MPLHYSRQKHLLFTHVSRTGGTTLTNCLSSLLPDFRLLLGQHEPLAAARPILGKHFEQSFKFAFVRNPWERFVSWYALIGQAPQATEIDKATVLDPESSHWKNFDSFLENWCKAEVLIDGAIRRRLSQWAQLTDAQGTLLVDDFGRFENFEKDAVRLLKKVGIKCPVLPTIIPSRHQHYSVYYSDFGREIVEESFAEDLKVFGYRFDNSVGVSKTAI